MPLGAWFALGVALLAASCAPAPSRPSMVIIIIDTLRQDHLGLYGYEANPTSPNLDARAASAAVFERAFSTAPWTLPAFGSLLTGQLPTRHSAGARVKDVGEAIASTDPRDLVGHAGSLFYQLDETLPTLGATLQQAGYRTGAIMNNAFLSPEFGLSRGFDTYEYDSEKPNRRAGAATDRALDWLRAREEADETGPFLLLVHYFDPHMPYAAPPPFQGRFANRHADDEFGVPVQDIRRLRYRIRDRVEGWERYTALEQALYDEEIAYTDSEVERLFAALDERGFLDSGYVVLTSDHGEEFNDHGGVEHGHSVYDEVIRVPFMVWGPEIEPGRYQLPVSLVDIMPTLLEAAGVAAPATFAGSSLWNALREGPASRSESVIRFDRSLLAEGLLYGDEQKALIKWPWKLLIDIEDDAQLFYNLDSDPAEGGRLEPEDLDEAGQDLAFGMLAELQAIMLEAGSHAPGRGAALSEETLQRLRALGYIR